MKVDAIFGSLMHVRIKNPLGWSKRDFLPGADRKWHFTTEKQPHPVRNVSPCEWNMLVPCYPKVNLNSRGERESQRETERDRERGIIIETKRNDREKEEREREKEARERERERERERGEEREKERERESYRQSL
jgi:hypothetical protein